MAKVAMRQQINNLKNIYDPYRCLALLIIAHDYFEDTPSSCRWLQSDDKWLKFWCEAAEISLDELHKRMLENG